MVARPFGAGRLLATAGLLAAGLSHPAFGQLSADEASSMRRQVAPRVEALTIFGGDYALAGGHYRFGGDTRATMDVSKFGGDGDVGDPQNLGHTGLAWQPRLQGSLGTVDETGANTPGPLAGGSSRVRTFAIQFGIGARIWFDEHFSLAPTLTGMYGHTWNTYTPAPSASPGVATALTAARQLDLVNWSENTWTLRPALDLQYQFTWQRTIVTLSSDATFFHTESFGGSSAGVEVAGDAASLADKIDVDIPLGVQVLGHELRTGGYLSRTELFDDLQDGLGTQHVYETHGRLVLDFLHQFWKVQWVGVGGSYLWGGNFTGWSLGADVLLKF